MRGRKSFACQAHGCCKLYQQRVGSADVDQIWGCPLLPLQRRCFGRLSALIKFPDAPDTCFYCRHQGVSFPLRGSFVCWRLCVLSLPQPPSCLPCMLTLTVDLDPQTRVGLYPFGLLHDLGLDWSSHLDPIDSPSMPPHHCDPVPVPIPVHVICLAWLPCHHLGKRAQLTPQCQVQVIPLWVLLLVSYLSPSFTVIRVCPWSIMRVWFLISMRVLVPDGSLWIEAFITFLSASRARGDVSVEGIDKASESGARLRASMQLHSSRFSDSVFEESRSPLVLTLFCSLLYVPLILDPWPNRKPYHRTMVSFL